MSEVGIFTCVTETQRVKGDMDPFRPEIVIPDLYGVYSVIRVD